MTLNELNHMPADSARREFMRCCGSREWVARMVARRPFKDVGALKYWSEYVWAGLDRADYLEAFSRHPRIGERSGAVAGWASQEQAGAAEAPQETLDALRHANEQYEQRFRHVFLICATGKSADEMLAALESRLQNDEATELRIAAAEQAKITQLRLEKLLDPATEPTRAS